MANKATILKAAFTLICSFAFFSVFAQQALTGPSDSSTPAPTDPSTVQKIVDGKGTISLSATAVAGNVYQWFKKDASGTMQLVQQGPSNTYTETPSAAGYYIYQLVEGTAAGCTSAGSDPFTIYVLSPWTAAITSSSASVCEQGHSTATLTALPASTGISTYTYQWTRNGVVIPTATSANYTVTETQAGNVTYAVTVTSALTKTSVSTATQVINVIAVPTKPAIIAGL